LADAKDPHLVGLDVRPPALQPHCGQGVAGQILDGRRLPVAARLAGAALIVDEDGQTGSQENLGVASPPENIPGIGPRAVQHDHGREGAVGAGREVEALKLVAKGLSNQEIADQLVIGLTTVYSHVSNILAKLHLASRTQAALYAVREGYASLYDEPDQGALE
jgi:DNA-binding CsgD family transcriptional regulator